MKSCQKLLALLIAAATLFALLPMTSLAAEFELDELELGYRGPEKTSLLVFLINYDPSLNGKDDEEGEMLLQYDDHSYWSDLFFSDDPKGLKAYFEIQSDGNFYFMPAAENYENSAKKNQKNDGIVEVSITYAMKKSTKGSTGDPDLQYVLKAAVENGLVDFSVFDKNKDGVVNESELVIALIGAGYESTRTGSLTPSYNAHASDLVYTANGVKVDTGYIKCGEMMSAKDPLTVGSFCHELGHVMGNGDLYNTKNSWGQSNSPAGKVSVMAGNGSAGKNSGELSGESPSNHDPYHLTVLGYYPYTTVTDGTYTLYSRQSEKGKYNILKVTTPNPNEYYLIENRYNDDSSVHFDSETNYAGTRGIIIWHIDESLANKGRATQTMAINSGGINSDIGVAALHPTNTFPANSGVFSSAGLVFDPTIYEFPGSETWHTSLTEEQAAAFGLKIEILDDMGHEMRIKVTNAYTDIAPRYTYVHKAEPTAISCEGQIYDLNGQTITSFAIEISESSDFSEILERKEITLDKTGNFSHTFEGLKEVTEYHIRLVFGTKNGTFYEPKTISTSRVYVEDTTTYEITFNRNIPTIKKPYIQEAKVGEPVVTAFPMTYRGYVFAGWYLDETLTEYFELADGKADHEDITLYAKWIKEEESVKLTVVGATLVNAKNDPAGYTAVGEAFRIPAVVIPEGKELLGWYADEACTTLFDFNTPAQSVGEVKIYAKWSDTSSPEQTTTLPAVTESTTASASESTEEATASTEQTSATTTETQTKVNPVALIAIAAVAVILVGGASAMLVLRKKKK